MTAQTIIVGVVAVKKKLSNPWIDHAWAPHAVLDGVPEASPWTMLSRQGDDEIWYVGPGEIVLRVNETGHYRDNLAAERPAVWVALRMSEEGTLSITQVSVDPYEGEGYADMASELVDRVPMPARLAEEVAAYIEAHHVETPFFKRKRDRHGGGGLEQFGVGHPLHRRGEPGEGSR
jgi:hypothetical protein